MSVSNDTRLEIKYLQMLADTAADEAEKVAKKLYQTNFEITPGPKTGPEIISSYPKRIKNDERLKLLHIGKPIIYYMGGLNYRYELGKKLGEGVFGICNLAWDYKEKKSVVIKSIKRSTTKVSNEVEILRKLQDADKDKIYGFVEMLNYFYLDAKEYIVFELLGLNLFDEMNSRITEHKWFEMCEIQNIGRTLAACLSFLREQKIIHLDIKPENIVMWGDSCKLIDFGAAKECRDSSCKQNFYVQTRWYRSAEIIVKVDYNCAVDIWSYGCIIAELITKKPLFPGNNSYDVFLYHVKVLGKYPAEILKLSKLDKKTLIKVKNVKVYSEHCTPLNTIIKNPIILDFLSKCLDYNPCTRITPNGVLTHEFLT